jgi:hypothetical protein
MTLPVKHPGDYSTGRLFVRLRAAFLLCQHFGQSGKYRNRECPALIVFGGSRFKPDLAGAEVDI